MPLGPPSSAMHVQGSSHQRVTVRPAALLAILDHYLRRSDEQARVIGTLLGTRTDGVVDVRGAFAVLHSETEEQVAVDMEYHQTMYDLHHRVNPKEVIVGWYSTGSDLNTYSALIQNFYSQETAPHQAIHIAVNTGTHEGSKPGVQAYVSSPVGVQPKPENCIFVPIPCELRFSPAERSGFTLLASSSDPTAPVSDLEQLERALKSVIEMLDRVLTYVQSVLAGEVKGDAALGRYLMDTFGASTDELEKGGFNTSLQDTLMLSYLANLARSQAEVSSRMALATAP